MPSAPRHIPLQTLLTFPSSFSNLFVRNCSFRFTEDGDAGIIKGTNSPNSLTFEMTTMRTYLLFFAAIILLSVSASAQFSTGQAADIVLGQPDFTTGINPASPSTTTMVPYSVAVDAVNSKIFVADASFNRVLRWSTASVASNDPAEAVFGQSNFTTLDANVSQTGMDFPTGVFIAPGTTILMVADVNGSRVLRFNSAYNITSGSASANVVLGAPDFNSSGGSASQTTVFGPYAVAADVAGHLYVADQGNNRVLRFDNFSAKTNGGPADGVLGQPDFTHSQPDSLGVTAKSMSAPTGVAIDNAGTLYVADQGNNRVLYFLNAAGKANGAAADGVIGQAGFTNNNIGHTASTLNNPFGVAIDFANHLYISDENNNRILCYYSQTAITTNTADSVLGQSNLNTNNSGTTAATLNGPAGIGIDHSNGYLWVADLGNYRVLRYTASIAPLPVELTSFTAAALGNKVELAWKTATEINNSGFEVQRSTVSNQQSTMSTWTKVAFVAGHGTINAPQNYSYTDASVSVGKYSYRLKQIDNDGKFTYGQTIEATVGITPSTVFLDNNYPNPFNPSTKISFVLGTTGRATLKVFNLLGQEVATLADGEFNGGDTQTFTFDASKLSSGIYYYQLKSVSGTQIKKMMLLK